MPATTSAVVIRAHWLDVIATDGGTWDLVWRIPLGGG
jgi:hypothetical protein